MFHMYPSFPLFSVLFSLVPLLVIGGIAVVLFQGITEWNKNNRSPRLTVTATVVAKRTHNDGGNVHNTAASTWYYATFQVESGDRMEFSLSGREYGMLAEGDRGNLAFQGTRYLSFERI